MPRVGPRLVPLGLALAVIAASGACQEAQREATPTKAEPAAPATVAAAKVRSSLTAEELEKCLSKERVDPASTQVGYTSLESWIAAQVEQLRELDIENPSNVDLLEDQAFERAASAGRKAASPQSDRVTKWLAWALGLTPHGIDVNYFIGGEGAELLAGFYDPKDQRVVVRTDGEVDGEEGVVLAHEFAHAATDQSIGLPQTIGRHVIDDAALAKRAISEGDATLLELRFVSRFTPRKQARKAIQPHLGWEGRYRKERANGAPYLFIDSFMFPYQWGLSFVCRVFRERGWKGVDRLYENPPVSTSQIMFPERYLKNERIPRPAPMKKLPAPFKSRARAAIGAAQLKALFEAPLDSEKRSLGNPLGRAASLASGAYELWVDEEDDETSALAVSLVEHADHRGVLCSSMLTWYQRAFFDAEREVIADGTVAFSDAGQRAVIACSGRNVKIGIGPTEEIARRLAT